MAGDHRRDLVDEALRALDEANAELASLVALHRELLADTRRLSKLAAELSHAVAHAGPRQQLEEMTASFNLMQQQIGRQIDEESRRFELVSNILKTKHDTAKNSISNIR